MALKRELLERALRDDPEPERFEAWLLERCLAGDDTHSVGSLLAMAREILDEYRLTARIPDSDAWLAAGAPPEDRAP